MNHFHKDQNLTPTPLHIQCPHCFKDFKTFKHKFKDVFPNVKCSFCTKNFWVEANKHTPSIILGHIKSNTIYFDKNAEPTKTCPRCVEDIPVNNKNCSYCGVSFTKITDGITTVFPLRKTWEEVIKNWHKEHIHHNFLTECKKQQDLVYGVWCYSKILKTDKNNQIAKDMINRMEALTWFEEEEISLPKKTLINKFNSSVNKVRNNIIYAFMLSMVFYFVLYLIV